MLRQFIGSLIQENDKVEAHLNNSSVIRECSH